MEMELFSLSEGDAPLIISVPHAGIFVPEEIKNRFTAEGRELADTDWHVPLLYQDYAAKHNVTMIAANYSRYVIDLNRPSDDTPLYPGQKKVPLCPDMTFEDKPVYDDGQAPAKDEIAERITAYWQPYHDELARQIERVKSLHGYAVLYDAHSIAQELPSLFNGKLPDINIGTAAGKSCGAGIGEAALAEAKKSNYSTILNGRFIGGYITRHYGDPAHDVHAVQMELVRKNYMDEDGFKYREDLAANLIPVLERVLDTVADNARAGIHTKTV